MANEVAKIDQFQVDLANNSKAIKSMLPEHVDLKKFQRITFTAIQKNPSLIGKDKLMEAVLDCAKDGLIPDGREAALVEMGGKVAYLPMVVGVLKKIRNSGELKSISAEVVHANDTFSYHIDEDGPHFTHKPEIIKEGGDIIGAYAVAITKDGGKYFEYLRMSDLEKIKKSAKGTDSAYSPWKNWPEQMYKKSAIHRLSKRLPMSTDIEDLIRRDEVLYEDDKKDIIDVTPPKGASPEILTEKLTEKKEAEKIDNVKPAVKKEEVGKKSQLDIF